VQANQSVRGPGVTVVALPSGDVVRLYAVHPRPPQVGQSTAERDAQFMVTALTARADTERHVLLGDLNSVPGSRSAASRRDRPSARSAGRVGIVHHLERERRSRQVAAGSYSAGAGLHGGIVARAAAVRSDHHPMMAELCSVPNWIGTKPLPLSETEAASIREIIARG
jgi:endonuclease/exonuclease/phosphatase family metal-dependent hydrolase